LEFPFDVFSLFDPMRTNYNTLTHSCCLLYEFPAPTSLAFRQVRLMAELRHTITIDGSSFPCFCSATRFFQRILPLRPKTCPFFFFPRSLNKGCFYRVVEGVLISVSRLCANKTKMRGGSVYGTFFFNPWSQIHSPIHWNLLQEVCCTPLRRSRMFLIDLVNPHSLPESSYCLSSGPFSSYPPLSL